MNVLTTSRIDTRERYIVGGVGVRQRVVFGVPVLRDLCVRRERLLRINALVHATAHERLQIKWLFLREAQRTLQARIQARHAQVLVLRLARCRQRQERKDAHCQEFGHDAGVSFAQPQ